MTTLDRERVLDELEVLATIEHALIVEHLSICCALGHDLEAEDGGPTTDRGREAATAASLLAQNEMFHFKGINRALVSSGRSARLDSAEGIPNTSGQVLPVPPDQAGLEQLLEREQAMATAVDERYIRLAPAVTTHPVFEAEVLDEWRTVILDSGPTHVGALTGLQSALQGLAPTEFLRATRRSAKDSFELLVEAVSILRRRDGTALDIGAGSLNSTRHLLSAGFAVHAVDTDPYTAELAAELDDPRLTVHCADVRDIPVPERGFDLIVAIHVLHLLPRRDIGTIVPRLVRGLTDGGVLCATFVGARDTWAAMPWRATALRDDEMLDLISDVGVVRLDELEYDGVNVLGQRKHWHTLRCLLRK